MKIFSAPLHFKPTSNLQHLIIQNTSVIQKCLHRLPLNSVYSQSSLYIYFESRINF